MTKALIVLRGIAILALAGSTAGCAVYEPAPSYSYVPTACPAPAPGAQPPAGTCYAAVPSYGYSDPYYAYPAYAGPYYYGPAVGGRVVIHGRFR